jgi:hypothetical protein
MAFWLLFQFIPYVHFTVTLMPKILGNSRLEKAFFCFNLLTSLSLSLWSIDPLGNWLRHEEICNSVRALLHSELIAHSQASIIRHVFCALADTCTLRWLKEYLSISLVDNHSLYNLVIYRVLGISSY